MRPAGDGAAVPPASETLTPAPDAPQPHRLLFLPGASGNTGFWRPVAERLRHPAERIHLGWPGFGGVPSDPAVNGFDDLLALVLTRLEGRCALIAQSMGGVLALQAALALPRRVTHLVLCATSGGLPMDALGAEDWRTGFQADHPELPDWFATRTEVLSSRLPALKMPVLLLWGEADPISPVRVGERLSELLPRSRLRLIPGADHDLALERAATVAPLIDAHLIGPHPDTTP
ncbi:MAG: alpha/beta hydrolase [Cyanobium sp. CACIAM 14]|nr:MAG: alpha/beta hydrolase [Cyanobium sp. CACIAM 14]